VELDSKAVESGFRDFFASTNRDLSKRRKTEGGGAARAGKAALEHGSGGVDDGQEGVQFGTQDGQVGEKSQGIGNVKEGVVGRANQTLRVGFVGANGDFRAEFFKKIEAVASMFVK